MKRLVAKAIQSVLYKTVYKNEAKTYGSFIRALPSPLSGWLDEARVSLDEWSYYILNPTKPFHEWAYESNK